MAIYKPRIDKKPKVMRKTKVETTYKYVPIFGEVLGFWRRTREDRLGESIEVYLNHSLEDYDSLFINGIEISILKKTK